MTCRVTFSSQTYHSSYWLKHPQIYEKLFFRLLACSGYRQIAREFRVSHTTIMNQTARLGRHCLLFQQQFRPLAVLGEPIVIDGFETFEHSQYCPCHLHTAVGADSHFFYAFTDSPLRRKGRMTAYQKRKRAELEARYGKPDPKSIRREIKSLLELVPRAGKKLEVRSDDLRFYASALEDLRRQEPELTISHQVTASKAARTAHNPLFPVNLLDGLIRHSSSNHKRETIAFSKKRQNAIEKLAILQVWRNFVKSWSEKRRSRTPAQRLGLVAHKLTVKDILASRLFPSRIRLPERIKKYYRRMTGRPGVPSPKTHRLRYAD